MTLALLGLVAGCSGAGNEDLFAESASGNDTSSVNPAPSPSKPPSGASQTPGGPSDPTTPATPAPTKPGTPPVACSGEIEPNNVAPKATSFASCLEGKLDGGQDVDWGSFVAPKGATMVSLKHSETGSGVAYEYFMNGLPLFADGQDTELEVVPGATYTVRISPQRSGNNNKPATYQLDIAFQ